MKYIKLQVDWSNYIVFPVEDKDFATAIEMFSNGFYVRVEEDSQGVETCYEIQEKHKDIKFNLVKNVVMLTDKGALLAALQAKTKEVESKNNDWYKQYTENQKLTKELGELKAQVEALSKVQASCPQVTTSLQVMVEQINEDNIHDSDEVIF